MKYWLILIIIIALSNNGNAQMLDTAIIKISYKFSARIDSTIENSKREDLIILEFGKKYSKCFSFYRVLRESMLAGQFSEQQKIGAEKFSINLGNFTKNGTTVKYFRNSNSNIITLTDQLLMDSYLIKDTVLDMKWTLQMDTATFVGYFCNKATTTFRGRKYSAWYTTEIPMPYGPYKFGGLPGVILFLNEEKGNFEFQCISIETLKEKYVISLEKKNYLKTDRNTHKNLVRYMIQNPDAFAASQGISVETISCEGCPPRVKPTFNPIELE